MDLKFKPTFVRDLLLTIVETNFYSGLPYRCKSLFKQVPVTLQALRRLEC